MVEIETESRDIDRNKEEGCMNPTTHKTHKHTLSLTCLIKKWSLNKTTQGTDNQGGGQIGGTILEPLLRSTSNDPLKS